MALEQIKSQDLKSMVDHGGEGGRACCSPLNLKAKGERLSKKSSGLSELPLRFVPLVFTGHIAMTQKTHNPCNLPTGLFFWVSPRCAQCRCLTQESVVHAMCVTAVRDDPPTESLRAMQVPLTESPFLCSCYRKRFQRASLSPLNCHLKCPLLFPSFLYPFLHPTEFLQYWL